MNYKTIRSIISMLFTLCLVVCLCFAVYADDEPEPDTNHYILTEEGILDSTGNIIGSNLQLQTAGTYTISGDNLEDYVDSRIQILAEGVTVVLRDVRMSCMGEAVIYAEYDAIICIQGDNYLTRIVDFEADPADDGDAVIKGESGSLLGSVDLTFIGEGILNIDAPKKGIATDLYFGKGMNGEFTEAMLDASVCFDGPCVNITSTDECVEANVVNFNAGSGTFISTGEDGINAGTDGDNKDEYDLDGDGDIREYMYPNLYPNLDFTQLSINIKGGEWTVIAWTDGLDSNGSVIMTGGDMQVFSSDSSDDTAVDYGAENGGVFTVTGGSLLAVGMNGFELQKTPDSNFVIFLDQDVQANSQIVISDGEGHVLCSTTGVKHANCILYCSAEIVDGKTCTVTVDGETSEAADPPVVEIINGSFAVVTGDYDGLYVRIVFVIERGGEKGLLPVQGEISEDGVISIPEMNEPGVTVKGVNVYLVCSPEDITAADPAVIAGDSFHFV